MSYIEKTTVHDGDVKLIWSHTTIIINQLGHIVLDLSLY